ncbi:MAG: hypothetical protein IKD50_01725 [Clostridia bacterium]|nr:hypothetical protein [Clostridia bacterium]
MTRVFCDRCGHVESPLAFYQEVEIRGYWRSPGRGKTFTLCRSCVKELKKDFMKHRYASNEIDGTVKEYMMNDMDPRRYAPVPPRPKSEETKK